MKRLRKTGGRLAFQLPKDVFEKADSVYIGIEKKAGLKVGICEDPAKLAAAGYTMVPRSFAVTKTQGQTPILFCPKKIKLALIDNFDYDLHVVNGVAMYSMYNAFRGFDIL